MPKSTPLIELERGLILAYHSEKLTIGKIAERINRSSTIVHNFLQVPDKYGTAKRSERPPALKRRDKRRLKKHASTGGFTANQLKKDLDLQASVRTVQRELQKDDNLVYIKVNKASKLTDRHMKICVEWVEKRLRFRRDWSRIVFSDEKKFNLDGPDGRKFYWHDLRKDKKAVWSRHSGGGLLRVLGAISSLGKSRLSVLEGDQDAMGCQQMLTSYLFDFTDNIHDWDYTFQHDNASIHHSKSTKSFLCDLNIKTIDWPALSPDLNPIENLWGIMARRVYGNLRQYESVAQLKTAVFEVWEGITTDLLAKLTGSMQDRCLAVVRSNGKKVAF